MKTFQQTSDEPYMRHYYKIVCTDNQYAIVDNYYDVYVAWKQLPNATYVEVIDEPQ